MLKQQKRKRNQKVRSTRRVYEYWLEHPTWSYAAIGRVFHITRERVRVIINSYLEKEHDNE